MIGKGYDDIIKIKKNDRIWNIEVDHRFCTPVPDQMLDAKSQLDEMKANKIDCRFLSVSPLHFAYESEKVTAFAYDFNNAMLDAICGYEKHFKLLATLPFPHMGNVIDEMERVMQKDVFVGVEIASNICGMSISGEMMMPFWEKAEALNAFVLIHPHYVIDDVRLQKKYLSNYVGNPLETTLAAFDLISQGILEKYPGLKICLSHGGGYLSLAAARFDHGFEFRSELKNLNKKPSFYAKKMYIDTIIHDTQCLKFLVDRWGAEKVLMGTDYPYDMGDLSPVRTINSTDITEFEKGLVRGGNIENMNLW